jgi:hypothetical protein
MILFGIILALVLVVGAISFKAEMSDSTNIRPGMGCAGVIVLAAVIPAMLSVLVGALRSDPFVLLLAIVLTGLAVAVLYTPFIAGVCSSFFERFLFPPAGEVKKTYDIAEKLTSEGRYTEAVAEYERVIDEDPEDVEARLLLGDVQCKMDQYELAARTFTEALELDLPPEKWCYIANRLADVLVRKTGEPQEAVRVLKRIAEKYPKAKFARYARERIERIGGS